MKLAAGGTFNKGSTLLNGNKLSWQGGFPHGGSELAPSPTLTFSVLHLGDAFPLVTLQQEGAL